MAHEGAHREGRRWGRWLLGLPAVAIIVVIAYIAVAALVLNPPGGGSATVTSVASEHHSPAPSPSETLPPLATKPPKDGVDPACFADEVGVNSPSCQAQVKNNTKFVVRYLTGQPAIAKAHPPVDTPASRAEGRTSLAYHGLELCSMLGRDDTTVFTLIKRFTRFYHDHAGPVDEYKTFIVTDVATAEICPERVPAFQILEKKFSEAG